MTDTIVVDTTTGKSSLTSTTTDVNTNNNNNNNTSFNKYNFLNLIAYGINCFITFGIGIFGLTGQPDNGELSDMYQTIVTPFGLSFSIWGVIFIWQAFWIVWQFLPSQRNSEGVMKAWYYYPIMTIFQAGWTISFSYEIMWLSLICMYCILITMIMVSMSLQKYKKIWKGYLLWQGPFSIQTGWIMAAAAVNTNVLPVAYNATPSTQLIVASLSLATLLITSFTWLSSYPVDFAIPIVIVWALGGVYSELQQPSTMIKEQFTTTQILGVQYGVLGGLCLVSFGIIVKILYVLLKQRRRRPTAAAAAAEAQLKNKTQEDQKKGGAAVSLSSEASSSPSSTDEEVAV
jgi:hypothetical protein